MEGYAERPESRPLNEPPQTSPDLPVPTPEQEEEAMRLVRQAHLARQRGEKQLARRLLEEARSVAPGSVDVLVELGDQEMADHHFSKAVEHYAAAMKRAPGNVTIERKHAEAIFCRLQGAGAMGSPSGGGLEDQFSAKSAAVLSAIVPGLGQIMLGQARFGIALMAIWAVGLIWLFSDREAFRGLIGLFSLEIGTPFRPVVLLPLGLIALAWSMGVMSAASRAKAVSPPKLERPRPPVEKDFEL